MTENDLGRLSCQHNLNTPRLSSEQLLQRRLAGIVSKCSVFLFCRKSDYPYVRKSELAGIIWGSWTGIDVIEISQSQPVPAWDRNLGCCMLGSTWDQMGSKAWKKLPLSFFPFIFLSLPLYWKSAKYYTTHDSPSCIYWAISMLIRDPTLGSGIIILKSVWDR